MTNPSAPATFSDQFGRPLHDLRVSLIDACNLRCRYCMPAERFAHDHRFLRPHERLDDDSLIRLIRLFVECGVRKVRLTGGEPLLRHDIADMVQRVRSIPGISDLALTTNGTQLANYAEALRTAGLDRLTISLDAADSASLSNLAGRSVNIDHILAGIATAQQAGFTDIKLNAVILRNMNEDQILPLAHLARKQGLTVRFIEYMDVGTINGWSAEDVVPAKEVLATLQQNFQLEPVSRSYRGEVAQRYRYLDGGGEVGLITSVSQPFCADCNRARITADGALFTCLFANEGLPLRPLLEAGASDDELRQALRDAWAARSDRYSARRQELRAQRSDKVEMYHVGG